jgi:3-methyl-2-oxobutanoate hydroxymethyltransferase
VTTRPQKPAPATPAPGKLPLPELVEMKRRREPIVMVTAYDAPGGRLADAAGVDIVLVGDSAAMTVLGYDSTVPATMDEMVFLTRAVTRGARRPLVVADMPFGSFQVSDETALENAIRFVKEAGADAVKVEGGGPTVSRVRALVGAGIPVMGHVGLTPQSATMLGGFKAQGRTAARARRVLEEALELEQAGCFSIVLEAVPTPVAALVTERLQIPTIGIGAGPSCDGQVLVYHDLLGLYEGRAPRFVKRYADVATQIRGALEAFAADVRNGAFPEEQHTYAMPEEELGLFKAMVVDSQRVDRSGQTDARAKPVRPESGTASGASGQQGEERDHRTQHQDGEGTRAGGAAPAPAVHDAQPED